MRYDVTHGDYTRTRLTYGEFSSILDHRDVNPIQNLKVGETYTRAPIKGWQIIPLTVKRVE